MTPALGRRERRTADDGGAAARRAVVRWAWRLFRREWRQQALVLGLLTVAVATAILFASGAYNTTGASEAASFGTANHRYVADRPDLSTLPAAIAAAEQRFGAVELIARWSAPVPGSVDSIDVRAQDPQGSLGGPMLALRDGRYPRQGDEVALTDEVADTLALGVGDTFDLDGSARRVVGMEENPNDLDAEFALVAPTDTGAATSIVLLVEGSGSFDEVRALRDFGVEYLPDAEVTSRSGDEHVEAIAVASVFGTASVALVLVGLVAAAGFMALAHRRQRQLGMLGAIGATERHLRLVVLANGAVLGLVAAVAGAGFGLAGWFAVAPRLEQSVGYRIDPLNVPWWLMGGAMTLALVTAVGSAWWPARTVARIPTTRALSGRPPPPQPAHHSALLAVVLVLGGAVCLIAADRTNPVLIASGTVATVLGVLLVSPLAIRTLGAVARWLPIAIRLALRDLARHQARSGIALAAISLTLGIPVAIVVTATAAEHGADLGNLSDRHLLVWTRDAAQPDGVSPMYTQDPNDSGFSPFLPRLTPTDVSSMERQVERIAAPLDGSTLTALELATDPALDATPDGRLAVTVAQRTAIGYLDVAPVFVATPSLLDHYGLNPSEVSSGAGVVTIPVRDRLPADVRAEVESDALWFGNVAGGGSRVTPERITNVHTLEPSYSSLPGSFITPDELRQRGWESITVGWLIETAAPLTAGQLIIARDLAAAAGVLVEAPDNQPSLAMLRWGATATGMLVALGVLAMTVGLIRNEAARDLRTLTATGATSGIRRTLTAATAGGMAMLGAALGTVGAYVSLGAGYFRDLATLTPIPITHLATIVIGVPAAAAATGWLVAGREPAALARQVIE